MTTPEPTTTITVKLPTWVHDRLVIALKQRYPGARVFPDNEVVQQGLIQLVVEGIEIGERDKFEQDLQEEMADRRVYRQGKIAEIKGSILAMNPPSGVSSTPATGGTQP